MVSRTISSAAVAALLLGAVPAQFQKGQTPTPLNFVKVWNNGPASFDDFAGRVVILKFSETW
jgi:hypothetical protein